MTILTTLCIAALVWLPQTPKPGKDRPAADTAYTCDTDRARSLARDLAADTSVTEVGCQASGDGVEAHNKLLEAFLFSTATGRMGALRLRKTCSTVEGDPIVHYLMLVDGEITLVTDSTADRFGPKQVCSARVARVEIGHVDETTGQFVSGIDRVPPGKPCVLRCLPQDWTF
jgi:hypothetical protein